jgi:hypothetical protein
MAYDELEDREMDESEMYEDESLYKPAATFGEQIGEVQGDTGEFEADELNTSEEASSQSRVEEAFGESINAEKNPHLADQMDDTKLNEEAQADYKDSRVDE